MQAVSTYAKIYFYSMLVFAFSLPLSRFALSFFVIWFVLLFLSERDYKATWKSFITLPSAIAFLVFFAYMLLTTLWSTDLVEAFENIRMYSYLIVIPIIATKMEKAWVSTIISAFLGGMFVSEVLSYGMFFDLWRIGDVSPDYPIPFMFHIHYSVFLATTAVIALARAISADRSLKMRIVFFLFFIASVFDLLISTGRTGLLGFIIAMVVLVIYRFKIRFISLTLMVLVGSTLFYGAYKTIPIFQTRIDAAKMDFVEMSRDNFNTSIGLRAVFWQLTYDILSEHPIAGVGLGDYRIAGHEAISKHSYSLESIEWCTSTHFHNQYLMIASQGGLIAVALLLWYMISLFKMPMQNRELKETSMLSLIVIFTGMLGEPLWYMQFTIMLFVLIVTASMAESRQDNPPYKRKEVK
jgi:O-antigen ligase